VPSPGTGVHRQKRSDGRAIAVLTSETPAPENESMTGRHAQRSDVVDTSKPLKRTPTMPTSRLCRLERGSPCGVGDPGGRGRHNHGVPRKARPRTSRTVRRCAPPQSALQRRSLAPASLGAGEAGSAGAAGLCRPGDAHPLTSQAIQHQGRHNQEVGIVGDIQVTLVGVAPPRSDWYSFLRPIVSSVSLSGPHRAFTST